jgi:phosphohistidine phosphatase SixA
VRSPLLVVRHASAGARAAWTGDDRLRPLDALGRKQAAWLEQQLSGYAPGRILSSPYVRCVQTVEPLATSLGVEVEQRPELAEGSSGQPLADLVAMLREDHTACVVCTHGDVACELVGRDRPCAKGSVWVMEWKGEEAEPTRYLAPPW